ncbi:Small GTPase superfamily, ARF/SAR type [Carpediemonas membranifera]|uniref:Small GTPase superfamily, ARF/SAR type n=1 Tax=Carpediemonas membranifera TaxID=201153 RepID=A0A8J6E0D7_9EUKA|nr:Small GTPase superfamily, ARF/SAR type [Carpediemonas membranifera]|eukprot:KAG9392063.1 Small GTPase superfamily, ARF/SAR type [Carpediemonas membranifera]
MGALFSKFLKKNTIRIVLVGVENAGKTSTMMRVLQIMSGNKKDDINFGSFPSTIGLNRGECNMFGRKCMLLDMGGQASFRMSWGDHFTQARAVLFVLDGADMEKYDEAKEEFLRIAMDPDLADMPLMLFINKSDLLDCASFEQVVHDFGLDGAAWVSHRQFRVMRGSALEGDGVFSLFRWLVTAAAKAHTKHKQETGDRARILS